MERPARSTFLLSVAYSGDESGARDFAHEIADAFGVEVTIVLEDDPAEIPWMVRVEPERTTTRTVYPWTARKHLDAEGIPLDSERGKTSR